MFFAPPCMLAIAYGALLHVPLSHAYIFDINCNETFLYYPSFTILNRGGSLPIV